MPSVTTGDLADHLLRQCVTILAPKLLWLLPGRHRGTYRPRAYTLNTGAQVLHLPFFNATLLTHDGVCTPLPFLATKHRRAA